MLRRVKPSRCVDARAENEADVIRCHVFRLDALHTDQLLQAEVLRFMERPKAGFFKNPVCLICDQAILDRIFILKIQIKGSFCHICILGNF